MAEICGVSKASVQRIWRANGLKPHLATRRKGMNEVTQRALHSKFRAPGCLDAQSSKSESEKSAAAPRCHFATEQGRMYITYVVSFPEFEIQIPKINIPPQYLDALDAGDKLSAPATLVAIAD